MSTKNPIELLISLGINDDTSKANVQRYLSKLKKDLKFDVEINVTNSKGNGFESMRKEIESLQRQVTQLNTQLSNVGSRKSNNQFETKAREINVLLQKMKDSGLLTSQEMSKFSNSLSKIETGNLVQINNLLTQMSAKFDKLKSAQSNVDIFDKQQNSLSRLNSELTRTEKLLPRSMDKSKVAELRAEIEKLSKFNILNPATLKSNQKDIDVLREKIKQFSADTSNAGKNSNGVLSNFKTAMERFPIDKSKWG